MNKYGFFLVGVLEKMLTSVEEIALFLKVEFLYMGHLQSLGLASIVWVSSFLVLDKPASLDIFLTVYLLFQIIYLFDRQRDIDIDRATNPERSDHLRRYLEKTPVVLCAMLILLAVLLFSFSNFASLTFAATVLVFGLLYPLYFKALTQKIYLFKNVYVSFVHALMVFFPGVYYSVVPKDPGSATLLPCLVFSSAMVSQIALDTKDTLSDRSRRLLTLPALIEKNRVLDTLRALSIASALVFLFLALIAQEYLALLLIAVNVSIDHLVINALRKSQKNAYFLTASRFLLWLFFLLGVKAILGI